MFSNQRRPFYRNEGFHVSDFWWENNFSRNCPSKSHFYWYIFHETNIITSTCKTFIIIHLACVMSSISNLNKNCINRRSKNMLSWNDICILHISIISQNKSGRTNKHAWFHYLAKLLIIKCTSIIMCTVCCKDFLRQIFIQLIHILYLFHIIKWQAKNTT